MGTGTKYQKFGWDNKLALGLSIGCYYDYRDSLMHWFDVYTLEKTVRGFVETKPLMVSFNGISFDFELMRGLLQQQGDQDREQSLVDSSHSSRFIYLQVLCDAFKILCATSYDILAEIWKADPHSRFRRGLNSLGVISEANGYGTKEMDGATAPKLWAQGRYAEVLNYCSGDVIKTRALFEQIVQTDTILRGDNQPITLRNPFPSKHTFFFDRALFQAAQHVVETVEP